MSVSIISHRGIDIIYIDFSTCKSSQEMLEMLDGGTAVFESDSHLTLTNVIGIYLNSKVLTKSKELGRIYAGRRKRNAIIGVNGIKNILLQSYNLFANDKVIPFGTLEEALDYLTKEK